MSMFDTFYGMRRNMDRMFREFERDMLHMDRFFEASLAPQAGQAPRLQDKRGGAPMEDEAVADTRGDHPVASLEEKRATSPHDKQDKQQLAERRGGDDWWLRPFSMPRWGEWGLGGRGGELATVSPVANIVENDQQYEMNLQMPGVPKENIKVEVTDDGVLHVSGQATKETGERPQGAAEAASAGSGNKSWSHSQVSFQQSMRLPANVDRSKLSVRFTDGALKCVLPKTAPTEKKSQAITVE